jgi:hypothetical protein
VLRTGGGLSTKIFCLKLNFWGRWGKDDQDQGPGDVVVGRTYLFPPESRVGVVSFACAVSGVGWVCACAG